MLCAGQSWQDKLGDVRSAMKKKVASVLVITALDEVACKYCQMPPEIMNPSIRHQPHNVDRVVYKITPEMRIPH